MKKRIFSVLLTVVLCLSMFVSVSATGLHISDPDYYLTDDEIIELNEKADYIYNTYGYYVMFCIVKDSDVEYVFDIAESQYKNETDCEYGLALAHNVEAGKMAMYATESAQTIFTEEIIDVLSQVYNSNESYFGGVLGYFESVEEILENGNANNTVSENKDETEFAPVERTLPLVVDNADILTDSEEAELGTKLNNLTETYKTEVAVVTVSDLEGKSPEAYADDYYDYNGYGYGDNDDGLLVVYKPGEEGERKLHITTHGTAIDAFSDEKINDVLYEMKDLCVAEEYAEAFNAYADKCEEILIDASTPPTVHWFWIPVCFAVGFVLSFIISGIIVASLKSVRSKANAKDYVREGSMYVNRQQDIFLYSNVSKTAIKEDKDTSSTHTSSSGREHGGGGISF